MIPASSRQTPGDTGLHINPDILGQSQALKQAEIQWKLLGLLWLLENFLFLQGEVMCKLTLTVYWEMRRWHWSDQMSEASLVGGGYFLVFSQVVRNHWPVIWPCTPPAKSCIPHSSLLPLIHISPLTSLCPAAAGIDAQISISINPQQTWGHPSQIVDLNSLHWQQFIASLKFWIHKLTRCSSDREISFLPHEGGEKHEDKEEAVG